MTIQQQLTALVEQENQDGIIPFLKTLRIEQRKELIPHIKALYEDYSQQIYVESRPYGRWEIKMSQAQTKIIGLAAFVCFSKADFEKTFFTYDIISAHMLPKVLPWYCPPWLSDYMNELATREQFVLDIDYDMVMELSEQGYITPGRELILKLLPALIYVLKDREGLYLPENLLKRPVTLQEHFWDIFQQESKIYGVHFVAPRDRQQVSWIDTIVKYAADGKINRSRLLKESLLATNRNFNKNQSGWFADLFNALQPATEELIALQKELWIVLNAPHSKPVNMVLQYCKELAGADGFDIKGFLDHVNILLSSTVKSILTATISILEKLAKKHTDQKEKIITILCPVFIHSDADIQEKAAVVIKKQGSTQSAAIREALMPYFDSMLANTRKLLHEYLDQADEQPGVVITEHAAPVEAVQAVKVPAITNFDELLFLASQAFENNQPWHFFLLPDALINLQQQIDAENVSKLQPALQRALTIVTKGAHWSLNDLDYMLCVFFIDFCILMVRKYPGATAPLTKVFEKNPRIWRNTTSQWLSIEQDAFYFTKLPEEGFYRPYKQFLRQAIKKLHNGNTLPLLSTPTTVNGYLDAGTLADRLQQYQLKQAEPDGVDLQLAIMRCTLEQNESALQHIHKLEGEYYHLMQFLLDKQAQPQGPFHHPDWWMTAALTKNPEVLYEQFTNPCYRLSQPYVIGRFSWKTTSETSSFERFDYKLNKMVTIQVKTDMLHVFVPPFPETPASADKNAAPLLYEIYKDSMVPSSLVPIHRFYPADTMRLMQMMPHHPDFLMAAVIQGSLQYTRFWEEGQRQAATKAIEALDEMSSDFGEMGYLLTAVCMLSVDKTLQAIAAAIWIKRINTGSIDSQRTGRMIGIMEGAAFAPLKRFTDLVTSHMWQISNLHNRELERLLIACIEQLPGKPVKDLKKLLEILYELLSVNQSVISSAALLQLLDSWRESATLGKVIKTLQTKIAGC